MTATASIEKLAHHTGAALVAQLPAPSARLSRGRRRPARVTTAAAAAVPVPAAPAPPDTTEIASPPAIYQRVVELGATKAAQPLWKVLLLGLVAGVYVGFGGLLMLNIGISCPGLTATNPGLQRLVAGAVGLPFGLLMVLICGAELFTGNCCIMAAAFYEGRISFGQLLRNWVASYAANLAGALGLVALVYAAGISPAVGAAGSVAVKKASLPFLQAFLRGIIANWLVNIAVWQATASTSLPGKVMGALIPIITFVGIGVEHSVANMFLLPMGIAVGADLTWGSFFMANLLPVTLGNIIGGAVCVAGVYALVHGRAGQPKPAAA